MTIGSYIRFGIGIALSAEIIRLWITNNPVSIIALILSAAFLVLAALWFAFRF